MKKIAGKLIFVLIPILVVLFLLYPTYRANVLEGKKNVAMNKAYKANNSTDSIAILDKYNLTYGNDLQSAKEKALKLGLDLRGGMYVTLEVDILKLIEESAQREAIDETFEEVLTRTRKEVALTDENVIDIFLKNFDKVARPRGKSLIAYYDIGDVKDASEEKIIERMKENANGAIDQALEVIRQRIDKYGVSEPNIQKTGTRRILVELPGVKNEEEIHKLLQTTARLEFKLVRNNQQIVKAFYKIDVLLAKEMRKRKAKSEGKEFIEDSLETLASSTITKAEIAMDSTVASDSTKTDSTQLASDTTNPYSGMEKNEAEKKYLEDHPFTTLFWTQYVPPGKNQRSVSISYAKDNFPADGDYVFRILGDSIKKFQAILDLPEIKSLIPYDLEILLSAKPDVRVKDQNIKIYDIYSLKRDPELTGDVVTDARATFEQTTNQPEVIMGMNSDGSDKWARITGANLHKRIAIVLDERVYSAPTVQSKITGGSSQITGMADVQEARLLEIVLKAGALKAPVQIIEERVVGPSLGEDSINSGLIASLIAAIAVILYMSFYYNKAGLVANFAVILNIMLIIAILAAFGGTLSLPGISGLILTLGMAVDANVLIFERIREEMDKGRSLKSSIDEGFSKAMSAIIDSNVTTFITGLILYFFGSGPIQGFAMTLMIGIIMTLYTAIFITRAIIEMSLIRGATAYNFGQPKISQA